MSILDSLNEGFNELFYPKTTKKVEYKSKTFEESIKQDVEKIEADYNIISHDFWREKNERHK